MLYYAVFLEVALSGKAYEREQPIWKRNGDFSLRTEYNSKSDSHPRVNQHKAS